MKDKSNIINKILNLGLLVMIISVSYAWMITEPSKGQIVDYKRKLVIPSNDLEIIPYTYNDETMEYEVNNTSPMEVGLTEPGKVQKYKFTITNNKDIEAITDIVFSNITGDIEKLKEKVYLGSTNQNYLFEKDLNTLMEYNETSKTYYIKFIEDLKISANSTVEFYWYTYIDQYASNEIRDTEILVEKIMFNN